MRIRRVPFHTVVEVNPETRFAFTGVTADPARLSTVLDNMVSQNHLLWWAARPPAADSVAAMVKAGNQGRWSDLGKLAGPGDLVIRHPDRVDVYDLPSVTAAMRYAMRTRWSEHRVTVCATPGEQLGIELAVFSPGEPRKELVLTGFTEGPMGRLHHVQIDADQGGMVNAWLRALRIEPVRVEQTLSA